MVQKKDSSEESDSVSVIFPFSTRHRIKGFQFKTLEWLKRSFNQCAAQLDDKMHPERLFLSSLSTKKGTWAQSMGECVPGKIEKILATLLGKDPTKYIEK